MLTNLTSRNFEPFGKLLSGNFPGSSMPKKVRVSHRSVSRLFINEDSQTLLDIDEGTAILFAGSDPENLQTFLLDKFISIKKDIYYYVTPLLNTAVISIAYEHPPRTVEIPVHKRPEGLVASIKPSVVHTLLYHEKEIGFNFKGEKHPFWELTYVDSGKMYNEVDGTKLLLSQGEITLFLPGQFHSQYAADDSPVRYLTISFDMDFSDDTFFDKQTFTCSEYVKGLLGAIYSEYTKERIHFDDLILCYLKEIVIALIRENKLESFLKVSHPEVRRSTEGKIAEQAKSFVRDNLTSPISVIDVANSIPVSESYMSRIFKKAIGISLKKYIITEKLEKSKELILKKDLTVTQVAESLGYSSVHHFSAQFKKTFGISPTEYADSILNGPG